MPHDQTSLRRAFVVILLAACAGCGTLEPCNDAPTVLATTMAPTEDGAILGRAPCKVETDPKAFADSVDKYYRDDILIVKLGQELVAKPLSTIFTLDENRRLAEAARDGRCEKVSYRSSGLRVAGFVLRPATPGPHPVLRPARTRR